VEGGEIFVEFFGREVCTGHALLSAALEGGRETAARKTPAGTIRLRIKSLKVSWGYHLSLRSGSAGAGLPA
jgi:hypothetical protein